MQAFDLDTPLIELASASHKSHWTVRHAVEGVQIFGGIGSGKTSGSGRMLALKFLKAGFGGLVLTVKPDERKMWQDYCQLAGREKDLLILEPDGVHSFNFLEYESSRAGSGAITENIVEVLKTVIRAGEQKDAGVSDAAFWETALDMLLFNAVDLCLLAFGKVTVPDLYEVVQTIPKSAEGFTQKPDEVKKAFHKAFETARDKINVAYDKWHDTLSAEQLFQFRRDEAAYDAAILDAVPNARMFKFLNQFFSESFVSISEKTRAIIDFTFAGFLFRLMREPFYSLICRHGSTLMPEDCLRGKIILLDLPVKLFGKAGRDCQILFKYIWQRAMERRDISQNARPLFLWADEAQNFLHEHDPVYQATARSSRIATVYISQNLPNYLAALGGSSKSDYQVKGFLGTLGTKIFHANADIETNKYASELFGEEQKEDVQRSLNIGKERSESQSVSIKFERVVRPEGFVQLSTGGPLNDYRVEGYMHRQGDPLFGSRSFKKMMFNQQYRP